MFNVTNVSFGKRASLFVMPNVVVLVLMIVLIMQHLAPCSRWYMIHGAAVQNV